MKDILLYPAGKTEAVGYAVSVLKANGIPIIDHVAPEITHLLLDVPSFGSDGMLRGGEDLPGILERLPPRITVAGGNLNHPTLVGYRTIDLLQDEGYLATNARITADCALQVVAPLLKTTFADTPTLIIGWGRIGKCLAQLLKGIGTDVTIAARKESDLAMAQALGYLTIPFCLLGLQQLNYRLILNTVPAQLPYLHVRDSGSNCVQIDLASASALVGEDVVRARGLPGFYAPESSGHLIAEVFLRKLKEGNP